MPRAAWEASMTTRVAFLRAVNLGKRRVAMARLKAVCEELGYDAVFTHINSGNVGFDAAGSRRTIESAMERACEVEFGFECTTFVRTAAELRKIVDATPFDVGSGDTHFVTFLKVAPTTSQRSALEGLSNEYETLVVDGSDVHWLMHGKSSDSRLTKRDWEKILGTNTSTSRNTTMLRKLVARLER
jgi:uncharacterized protein (DUF1697 family)